MSKPKVKFRVDRYVWVDGKRWTLAATYEDAYLTGRRENRWVGGSAITLYVKDRPIVEMDAITDSVEYGSGQNDYTGIVSFTESELYGSSSREVNEWNGRGNMERIRLENWSVHPYAERKQK